MPLYKILDRGSSQGGPEGLNQNWDEIRKDGFAEVTSIEASSLILGVSDTTWNIIKHGLARSSSQVAEDQVELLDESV